MLQNKADPRTPRQAAIFAQETLERVLTMSFTDEIEGAVLTPPAGGPKRYLNVKLRFPGMDIVATLDLKAPGWRKESGPTGKS